MHAIVGYTIIAAQRRFYIFEVFNSEQFCSELWTVVIYLSYESARWIDSVCIWNHIHRLFTCIEAKMRLHPEAISQKIIPFF